MSRTSASWGSAAATGVAFAIAWTLPWSGTACSPPAGADADAPPAESVILFVVDTLRADALSTYAASAPPTPHADRLAAQSLVFENAYTQATNTHPSMSSVMTGRIPMVHGVLSQPGQLRRGVVPLAPFLKTQGLETGSFVANLCRLQATKRTVWSEGWDELFCGMDRELEEEHWEWDERVLEASMDWIGSREERFFAWVHLMDPHDEHRPPPDRWDYDAHPLPEKFEQLRALNTWEVERSRPPADERAELLSLYHAEVAGIDDKLGRFLDFLDTLPNRDSIALIFLSDHGEELYETWHRLGHGFSVTEGVLRVPLMVRARGVEPGRFAAPVETMAVAPTVLELLDLPAPQDYDAPSLLAEAPSRGFALSFESNILASMRQGEHRYWFRYSPEPYTREEAEWRVEAPWFENRENLARYSAREPYAPQWLPLEEAAHRGRASELKAAMDAFREALGDLDAVPELNDPELKSQLESLGYLVE